MKRAWRYYVEPSRNDIMLGRMASSGFDTINARSCCANYAQTRRNLIATVYNTSGNAIVCPGPDADSWTEWISIPVGNRIIRPGILRVHLRYTSTSELSDNNIHCKIKVGHDEAISTMGNLSTAWRTIDVSLRESHPSVENLSISFRTEGTNTLTIFTVDAYQPDVHNGPGSTVWPWTDLDDSSCVLGDDDFPDSVLSQRLLRDNVAAVRDRKTPRNNVYHQWFRDWHKADFVYGASNDDLGNYKFVKRADVTVLKIHILNKGSTNCEIRAEITGLTNAPAEGAAQSAFVTNVIGTYPFTGALTFTWTLVGVDITDEVECGLKIDGRDNLFGTEVYVPGIYLVESGPSTSIIYEPPDIKNTKQNSDILASTFDKIRTTCNHLWYYGGRSIILADWRFGEYSDSYAMTYNCNWTAGFSKGAAGPGRPPVSRSLLYSSTGTRRIRTRMLYKSTAGDSHIKSINTQTTENLAGGDANAIDADPIYDGATNNTHNFTRPVDGAEGRPISMVEGTELDIRKEDWEEHYDGANEPPQCIIQAMTANAAEYISPIYVTVEEREIAESEFPSIDLEQYYYEFSSAPTDYIDSQGDYGGDFDPVGSFTAMMLVEEINVNINQQHGLVGKANFGLGLPGGWEVSYYGPNHGGFPGGVQFEIAKADSLGSSVILSGPGPMAVGRKVLIACMYTWVGDGSSIMRIVTHDAVNGELSTQIVNAEGPTGDTPYDLRIGSTIRHPTSEARFYWNAFLDGVVLTDQEVEDIWNNYKHPIDDFKPTMLNYYNQAVAATYLGDVGNGANAPYVFDVFGTPTRGS
jgi:hypothetical protein